MIRRKLQEDLLADSTLVAERVDELRDEVRELERLSKRASDTKALGKEAKLEALRQCLELGEFAELKTVAASSSCSPSTATPLDYLRNHLEDWGYLTTAIHGGMSARDAQRPPDRVPARQADLRSHGSCRRGHQPPVLPS